MNSFAKGEPPGGPPNVPPPPIPANRRADTPAVLQQIHQHQQQQQQQKPSSPRRPATDLKFHPPGGGGAPVNPPPPLPPPPPPGQGRYNQGSAPAPPNYPPPAQPMPAPSYPPPAPPVAYGNVSPTRRPRADSDAATSKLTEGFTASSDADMSYYPAPKVPVPEKPDRREVEFRESGWRNSMPAPRALTNSAPANVLIGADGLMGTGNVVSMAANIRDRLGEQREQYYSEPNMGNPTSRRTRHVQQLVRTNSNREKAVREDVDARASSPTLRDIGKAKVVEHRSNDDRRSGEHRGERREHRESGGDRSERREHRESGGERGGDRGRRSSDDYISHNMRGANDMERDFADDSDASAVTAMHPAKPPRHVHRQPTDSPSRPPRHHAHRQNSRHKLEQPHPKKRPRQVATCDYDDEALAKMNYSTLREQGFDMDPAQAAKSSRAASHEVLELPDKLAHFAASSPAQQLEFFQNMALADWEASGDWFTERFADMMHRLRESRQARRRVIAEFEDEIAVREEAVRTKTEGIDRKLRRMHHNGLKIMSD